MLEAMMLDRFLSDSADRRPEKTALVIGSGGAGGEKRVSYGEALSMSLKAASALRELGLRRGDRVVIALENSPEYLAAHFGALINGCVSVPLNHNTPPAAFLKIAGDCGPKAVISRPNFHRNLVKAGAARNVRNIIAGAVDDEARSAGCIPFDECLKASGPAGDGARTGEDLATIIYTSGTTGEPKGVMLSHRNLAANTRSIVKYLSLTSEDSVMVVLPFYYSYGNSLLLTHIMQGGTLVVDNRFMYPNAVLDTIAREEVTGFAGVPSTFAILCHRSNFRNMTFPALRYLTQAGGPMPHEMAFEILKTVPHVKLYIMYGQTEASARLSYLPPDDIHRKTGSVGKAVPGVTLEVLDEGGSPVAPGEIGEIVASGDNIMMGYWGNPTETSAVIRGGKLYTGDMATVDEDGYIYIVSRRKEMIKSGAHRIAPREIEETLLKDRNVFEAAVVGREDPILGEAIAAFVVLKDGHGVTETELLRLCRENLPLYKMPKEIYFIRSLPKTENMKVRKEELKKILQTMQR